MNGKRIFIVEDDPSILEDLIQIFEMENFPVLHARNGQEALNLLNSIDELPGLICLDLMLPVMDGQKFLTVIQSSEENTRLKVIPILVVSASKATVEGKTVGNLKKPPDIDQLLDFAEKYCGR